MNKVSELFEKMKRVVVLRIEDYEFMKSLADLAEHYEIEKLVENRKSEEAFTLDEVLAEKGLSRDD